ncbi:hypothetical protein GMA10_01530 [Kocuria koreensis]|jgi:hypothetical protein|uniref:Uncharacterized protein n=1 Tax=Rothia koreensis TaxID=592378 RepID=A0A7K1LFP4_9MICC|nr:hypothetical protein [Rothia koreensis]MUN53920.1 hypothetical protein [Rothia koreensis]
MTTSADDLRAWARGLLPLEAAVELLVTACGGALLAGPWIRRDNGGQLWFDPTVAEAEGGYLSGGERRVLDIATSLASGEHPVDLSDALTDLDRDVAQAVLAAVAHASGWDVA